MAEPSRSPSLPSTADEVAYAPVSWLAVGSVAVAGLFVLLLLFFGIDAYRGKKSLIMPELLLLAGIAVVLSFAARRVIRTSEGTRTGESLTNVAWWTAIVVSIIYGAYWLAIEYSIRRDARDEVQKWVGHVLQGDLARAFHGTLEPGRRIKIAPNDEKRMTDEFRDPMTAFRQSDVVRLAMRSKGECQFVPGGLRDWVTKAKTIDCVYTGTIRSPEGMFPVHIPLKGTEGITGAEGGAGRQWQIVPSQNGYVQIEKLTLTRYGWMLTDLEQQCASFGRQFTAVSSAGLGAQPYAYQAYVKPGGSVETWSKLGSGTLARIATTGGLGMMLATTPDYTKYINESLFRLPNGAEPTAEQKKIFLTSWSTYGLAPSGARLKSSIDTQDMMTITREGNKITRVEVRVPAEIPLPGPDSDMLAARARVIVECTDPAALEELSKLHETGANPDQGTQQPPDSFRKKLYTLRVTRIESDLYRISGRPQQGPEGGRGPGG